ncbi:MAG: ceramidase domain-containing protein [Pseudolabrys sp.]
MWSEPVDQYCERVSPAFWAEPVNAVTNLAFLLAALAAFLLWRRDGNRDWPVLALIVVVMLIGLGSFAFHTLATRGARLLDVVPIGIFIYGYLTLALRRFLGMPWTALILVLLAFIALTQLLASAVPREFLNGSSGYFPALAALIVVGALTHDRAIRTGMFAAAATFIASLAFRIVDLDICAAVPTGTHFLWHVLNAMVLYILLRTAVAAASGRQHPLRGNASVSR